MPADELIFSDGLGDRLLMRDANGKPLHESLLVRAELSVVPSVEFSLNQRLTQLDQFDHPSFIRVRKLVRITGALPRLSLVGDYAGGTRLSEVLSAMEQSGSPASTAASVFVIREILDALSALHRQGAGAAHGALAPERIVVTGRIHITDYVLGSAIEQLRYSVERYWKDLRVAVPGSAGAPRLDRRSDVAQVGMIALAMFAGRPLGDSEHMGNLDDAVGGLTLPFAIKTWLLRMLHLDPRRAYVSAHEAFQGLEGAAAEAKVRPTPLVFGALGIRTQRTSIAATVPFKTSQVVAPFKKADVQAAAPEPRHRHDSAQARHVGERMSVSAEEGFTGWLDERSRMVLKVGLLCAALAAAFAVAHFVPAPASLFSQTGTLVVESNPSGAAVFVDGKAQGVTPVTLPLKSGAHEVELRGGGKRRVFNVNITSGASVSQYVELRGASPAPRPRKVE